jgi:hypothetical protein
MRQQLFVNVESLLIREFHPDNLCYVNATMPIPRITGTWIFSAKKDPVPSCPPGCDFVVGDVPGCGLFAAGRNLLHTCRYIYIFVSHVTNRVRILDMALHKHILDNGLPVASADFGGTIEQTNPRVMWSSKHN